MLIVAVVISALLHAAWNALLRGHPDRRAGSVAVLAVCGVSSTIAALIDLGLRGAPPFPDGAGLGASVVAGVFEALYFAALARGLALGGLGTVYTISRGGAVALVWPASMLWFGERAGAIGAAGAALVLVGLGAAGLERGAPRPAVAWALVSATCICGYHLFYKVALATGAAPPAVFAVGIVLAVPIQAAVLRIGPRAALAAIAAGPVRTIAGGLCCTAGFLLFLAALRGGGAAAVLTLRNTSVVFALVFSAMQREHPTRRQVIGPVLVAGGAALVGLDS